METTYGDRLHSNRQVEENNLVGLVANCVRRGDKVLIPAFALGRAQEVLLLLKAAIQNRQMPVVPVYADGMVRDINRMYERTPTYLRGTLGRSVLKGNQPFYTKEITPVPPEKDRDELLSMKGPAVFVASSGMPSGGPSVQYARRIAAMEGCCIIVTGYQDEESPGRRLTELLEQAAPQPGGEEEAARALFGDFGWKKISFYTGERKALLNFDFPDVVNRKRFETGGKEFYEKTGWKMEIAPSMNFSAASALLAELFGN